MRSTPTLGGDLPDGEVLADAAAARPDADALERLQAFLVALAHADHDLQGVARGELPGCRSACLHARWLPARSICACLQRPELQPARRAIVSRRSALSTSTVTHSFFMSRPQVRAPFLRQPLRLGQPPRARWRRGCRRAAPPGPAAPGTPAAGCSSAGSAARRSASRHWPTRGRPAPPGSSRTTASMTQRAAGSPPGEHEIADRDFLGAQQLGHPLVHVLVVPAAGS